MRVDRTRFVPAVSPHYILTFRAARPTGLYTHLGKYWACTSLPPFAVPIITVRRPRTSTWNEGTDGNVQNLKSTRWESFVYIAHQLNQVEPFS